MTTLYNYRADKITLSEAIEACQEQLDRAISLLYSPDSCKFLWFKDGAFEYPPEQEKQSHKIETIFEARIFTEACELRWLNCNSGTGQVVLLSNASDLELQGFEKKEIHYEQIIEQQYLLWGEAVKKLDSPPGWQRLAEARIGKIDIPIDIKLKPKERVLLKTCEYINISDDYGNFSVIEERLAKLEVFQHGLNS